MFFGVISNNATEASQMIPASLVPLVMWSDYLVRVDTMPSFVQWIADVNPLYYLFRCFMIVEFRDASYDLSEGAIWGCESKILAARYLMQLNQTASALAANTPPPHQLTQSNSTAPTNVPYSFNTTLAFYNTTQSVDDCALPVPGTRVLEGRDMEPSDLEWYWLYIVIISVTVRLISMILLYVNNNNGWSWLSNKLKKNVFCCCYAAAVDQTNTEEQMASSIEIDMQPTNGALTVNAAPDLFINEQNDAGQKVTPVPDIPEGDENEISDAFDETNMIKSAHSTHL